MPDEPERCDGCGGMIEPDWCWCGERAEDHGYYAGHPFVPMGCNCLRDKGEGDG